jgi:transposase
MVLRDLGQPDRARHLLTHDCDYTDLGGDYFTRRNTNRQRDRLIKQLHTLGYRVTLDKAA